MNQARSRQRDWKLAFTAAALLARNSKAELVDRSRQRDRTTTTIAISTASSKQLSQVNFSSSFSRSWGRSLRLRFYPVIVMSPSSKFKIQNSKFKIQTIQKNEVQGWSSPRISKLFKTPLQLWRFSSLGAVVVVMRYSCYNSTTVQVQFPPIKPLPSPTHLTSSNAKRTRNKLSGKLIQHTRWI